MRVVSGEKTAFAYSDEIGFAPLLEAARATRAIGRQGGNGTAALVKQGQGRALYQPVDPLASLNATQKKVALLEKKSRRLRARWTRVWCKSWPVWPRNTTLFILRATMAIAPPMCARWCACR